MEIQIYPLAPGGWTFREQPSEPLRVRVPRGSKLLFTRGLGWDLFVPDRSNPRVSVAWSASQVVTEASKPKGRFKVLEAASV